jgi:hypothetical protein
MAPILCMQGILALTDAELGVLDRFIDNGHVPGDFTTDKAEQLVAWVSDAVAASYGEIEASIAEHDALLKAEHDTVILLILSVLCGGVIGMHPDAMSFALTALAVSSIWVVVKHRTNLDLWHDADGKDVATSELASD